jgi:hypothetical protein
MGICPVCKSNVITTKWIAQQKAAGFSRRLP